MKETAEVAVLISIHNGAPSLDRCFASIAAQSFQSWRIVCVDDASSDTTPRLLQKWRNKLGDRLVVIKSKQNLGLTKSLNKGLGVIKAPYTARIDADDWWHKDKLKKQLTFLEEHPECGVVGSNYVNVGPRGEKKVVVPETDRALRTGIIRRSPFAHSAVLFRTELVKRMGGYDETVRYGQDYELWLRLLPHTSFYNLQDFLCYRTVGKGISVDRQREQMLYAIKIRSKYIKKYHMPISSYLGLVEPLLLLVTPNIVKTIKRKLFG